MRALIEPVPAALVGSRLPAESPAAFVDDDGTTRPRDERRCGEPTETAADDMNLCIFHAPTTTSAPRM
jgi:hypothetical protein